MTREQLKKWFDKLLIVYIGEDNNGQSKHHFAGGLRMRIVTWEDIKNLARRIEATKEDK